MTLATKYKALLLAVTLIAAWPTSAEAQDARQRDSKAEASDAGHPAIGTEVWASTDSDGTQVVKLFGRALWRFDGSEDYGGLAFEHAWFTPAGGRTVKADRVYFDLADHVGADWRWKARVGTDGHTAVGSAELRRADWSRSLFLEREIVETKEGLQRKIYYTFVGASGDIPIDDNNTLAVTAGVQKFSGKNERLHVRGRYVHIFDPKLGLSGLFDIRYYHSTKPNEFDYFSPANFVRMLPIVQLRRFDPRGWMYLAAVGVGLQRSTSAGWTKARYAQVHLESPASAKRINAFAELTYANDSITAGPSYDYFQGRAGVTVGF
jgi:hypothetical protein